MQKKSYVVLFTFILKNKLTIILIVLLVFLFKQNILSNNFPSVVIKKQKNIESIEITNFNLLNENLLLTNQIISFTKEDLSLIESKARYKYGLIKDGEVFFKIKKNINTDNLAESSESTL